MYNSEAIVWIKNIKRNDGQSWAYENVTCTEPFLLHWPTAKKGSAATPNVGNIITLFQKPNRVNGRTNKHVHLTHLVTPISNEILEDPDSPRHKWCRQVQLIAKADPISAIPNPGYFNFFLPNRGLTNPIINLENRIDLTETETKDRVWELFQPYLCPGIRSELFLPDEPLGIFGEVEGDLRVREHIRQEYRQRNSRLVDQVKSEAFRRGNGRILCECCNFDFVARYGIHGNRFIECHHKIHMNLGLRVTQPTDLALVCSNCHRMLHRRRHDETYYSVEELRTLILGVTQ
jgi:HNH endonuclease